MFFFAHRGAALHHQVLALGASATGVSALDRSVDGGPAGQTALHALARGLGLSYERAHAICAALVAAGADVRARNAEGLTPLALAARLSDGDPVAVRALLAIGADPREEQSDQVAVLSGLIDAPAAPFTLAAMSNVAALEEMIKYLSAEASDDTCAVFLHASPVGCEQDGGVGHISACRDGGSVTSAHVAAPPRHALM